MSYAQRWADAVALLVKRPRTKEELIELTGISKNSLDGVLYSLRDEGLLRQIRQERTEENNLVGSLPDLWAWAAGPAP